MRLRRDILAILYTTTCVYCR